MRWHKFYSDTRVKVIQFIIKPNGFIPNNATLPVLLYKGALHLPEENSEELVKEAFHQNKWGNAWVDSIYDYHHYHSITHEVLGVIRGKCTVMLGGERGIKQVIERGDALILPAGVAHKRVDATDDFVCVGAYPKSMDFDMNYGKADEHPAVDENIRKVPIPETDPLYGKEGPLVQHWRPAAVKQKINK